MMNNVKYLSFALILAFSACKSGSASSQEPSEKQDTVKIFNLPQIPVVLNTVEQRTDYMVTHYSLNTFSEIQFYKLSLYISYLQIFSFGLHTHKISRV